MKLTIPLISFLAEEKASLRLTNVLRDHVRRHWEKTTNHAGRAVTVDLIERLTLSEFIARWPVARLQKECSGFGKKMQAELLNIMERHAAPSHVRFYAYVASLRPPEPSRTCVYCGCTDDHACQGGCSWVLTFQYGRAGVCSTCVGAHVPLAGMMGDGAAPAPARQPRKFRIPNLE